MEISGDKSRIRRAYLRARRLNLSPKTQTDLIDGIGIPTKKGASQVSQDSLTATENEIHQINEILEFDLFSENELENHSKKTIRLSDDDNLNKKLEYDNKLMHAFNPTTMIENASILQTKSPSDFQDYLLDEITMPSQELRILLSKTTYNDDDIDRIHELSRACNEPYLVQKSESIRRVRSLLNVPEIEALTHIKPYSRFLVPEGGIFDLALHGLSLTEKKFISAYLRIGPWIHIFLKKDASSFKALGKFHTMMDPLFRRIHSFFEKIPIALPKKVLIEESHFISSVGCEIPSFCSTILPNDWSKTLGRICQITAFNSMISNLNSLSHLDKQIRNSNMKSPIRKWLERSGKDTKLNWHQLCSVNASLSHEEATRLLFCFSTRLTTLICQNDELGLWSLSKMELTQDIKADFEHWLLNSSTKTKSAN